MATSARDIRELQASIASELAYSALSLTTEPGILYAESLRRCRELIEVLEVTATALLLNSGVSWETIGRELDGVTRQSFHRRLSPKVAALRDGDPHFISFGPGPLGYDAASRRYVPSLKWVEHLERLQSDLSVIAEAGNHPAIVKHRRKAS